MHYKNGREAKNGDKVVLIGSYGQPVAGILYDAVAGNDYCNGRIAITSLNDPMPNLQEVLHADDIKNADVKDSSAETTVIVTKEPDATVADKAADAPVTDKEPDAPNSHTVLS